MPGKVLFVAYQIPPIGGPAAQRHLRFLTRLPGCGWEPFVLSVNPKDCEEYYQIDYSLMQLLPPGLSIVRARSFNPMDRALLLKKRIFYLKNKKEERCDSAQDSQFNANKTMSLWQQSKDLFTDLFRIPDRQIGWYPFAVFQGAKIIRTQNIQVVYSSGNPWTCHLVAMRLAKHFKLPWVADFRDPWMGNSYKTKRVTVVEKIEKRLERNVVTSANYVVANTKPLQQQFIERYPDVHPEKIVHISNGYLDSLFRDLRYPVSNKRFTLSHVGSLYAHRSPTPLLNAVAKLKTQGILNKENFLLRFIGVAAVPEASSATLQKMGLDKMVEFIPPVSHAEALACLAASDVLLLIQPATKLQIPGKTFEYIAMGKPIFAVTGQGATADLLEEEGVGISADSENVNAIVDKLQDLFRQYNEGNMLYSSDAVLEKFESRPLTQKLVEIFEDCLEAN